MATPQLHSPSHRQPSCGAQNPPGSLTTGRFARHPLASSARPPAAAIRLPRSPDHRLGRLRPCAVRLIDTRMPLHAACAAGRGLPSSSSSPPRAGGRRSLSASGRPRGVAFAAPLRTRAGTGCGVRGLSARAVEALRARASFAYAVQHTVRCHYFSLGLRFKNRFCFL